jgi:hypothetical protein
MWSEVAMLHASYGAVLTYEVAAFMACLEDPGDTMIASLAMDVHFTILPKAVTAMGTKWTTQAFVILQPTRSHRPRGTIKEVANRSKIEKKKLSSQ